MQDSMTPPGIVDDLLRVAGVFNSRTDIPDAKTQRYC
jgi:hypothetical protein